MPMVPQVSHEFKSEGRTFTVKAETQSTHVWVNGEPVFTDTEVMVMESTNADGYDHRLQVVMPLAAALEFAKAVLAAQQQAEADAAYEAWLEEKYQQYLDYQALADSALEREVSF